MDQARVAKVCRKSKNPEWLQSAKLQLLLEEAKQDFKQSILTNEDIINLQDNTNYRNSKAQEPA